MRKLLFISGMLSLIGCETSQVRFSSVESTLDMEDVIYKHELHISMENIDRDDGYSVDGRYGDSGKSGGEYDDGRGYPEERSPSSSRYKDRDPNYIARVTYQGPGSVFQEDDDLVREGDYRDIRPEARNPELRRIVKPVYRDTRSYKPKRSFGFIKGNSKIDLLFYSTQKKDRSCRLTNLGQSIYESNFMAHLSEDFNWRFTLATPMDRKKGLLLEYDQSILYTDLEPTFGGWKWIGKRFVEKEEYTDHKSNRILSHSILGLGYHKRYEFDPESKKASEQVFRYKSGPYDAKLTQFTNRSKDPLLDLAKLLSNDRLIRKGSTVVLFWIQDSDTNYTTEQIEAFREEFPQVALISLLPKRLVLANKLNNAIALSEHLNGGYRYVCDKNKDIALDLLDDIQNLYQGRSVGVSQ